MPYSLLHASALELGTEGHLLLIVFVFFFFGVLVIMALASPTVWLIVTISRFVQLVVWSPRQQNKAHWQAFLRKYHLNCHSLIIHPIIEKSELHAFRVAWFSVVAIPKKIWDWYLENNMTYLSRDDIEVLILHEIGHLYNSRHQWLLKSLGALTFVGQGYFDLTADSLKSEIEADKFAQQKFEQRKKDNSSVNPIEPDRIITAVMRYERC